MKSSQMNALSGAFTDENSVRMSTAKRGAGMPTNTRTRALASRTANISDRALDSSSNSIPMQNTASEEFPNSSPDFSNELKEFGLSSCKNAILSVFPFDSLRIALQSKISQGQVTDAISLKWDPKRRIEYMTSRIESLKTAVREAIQSYEEAMTKASTFDGILLRKMIDLKEMEEKFVLARNAHAAAVKEGNKLTADLAQARADLAQSQANEAAANDEIDRAAILVEELKKELTAKLTTIASLEEKLEEEKILGQGLADDKEELMMELKYTHETMQQVTEQAKTEKAKILREAEIAREEHSKKAEELGAKIANLEQTVTTYQGKTENLEGGLTNFRKRVQTLENDLEAMTTHRDTVQLELEATKAALTAKEGTLASTLESFTRATEMAHSRDQENADRIEKLREKLSGLSYERDGLRTDVEKLKNTLHETEMREASLRNELTNAKERIVVLSGEVSMAVQNLEAKKTELEELKYTFEVEKAGIVAEMTVLKDKASVAAGLLAESEKRNKEAEEAALAWKKRDEEMIAREKELVSSREKVEESLASALSELSSIRGSLSTSDEERAEQMAATAKELAALRAKNKNLLEVTAKLEETKATLAKLQEDFFEGEAARRQLLNAYQELKGNIRVLVRLRPFLPSDVMNTGTTQDIRDQDVVEEEYPPYNFVDDISSDCDVDTQTQEAPLDPVIESALTKMTPSTIVSPDGSEISISVPCNRNRDISSNLNASLNSMNQSMTKSVKFSFDHVFRPKDTQEDVFGEVVHLVQSVSYQISHVPSAALDGYNVCLFSYGQTGSGKTHTMQGGRGNEAGLIPRSVKHILRTVETLRIAGWKYKVEASFLEIYNEQIRDLAWNSKSEPPSLAIHQDADGKVDVPGLTRTVVTSERDVDTILMRAMKRRAVAATSMNSVSSRSHAVFTLHLRGEHPTKGVALLGSLNLVDLAGSERLNKSKAEGDRKKETAAINKSLSSLADVFVALAKKSPHIPFRNSRLTHLLAPCFRGDGKTMMIVNLSPTVESSNESLCSLKFAAQVSQVEVGKPRKRAVESIQDAPVSAQSTEQQNAGLKRLNRAPSAPVQKSRR